MLIAAQRKQLLLICEVLIGIGHLARTLIIARSLSQNFDVTVVIIGSGLDRIEDIAGLTLHRIERPEATMSGYASLSKELIGIAALLRPAAVLIEYFPFGRHSAVPYLLPFLAEVRRCNGPGMRLLCMLRDIQQANRPRQHSFDELVVRFANKYFDRILVHADPDVTQLQDTFSAMNELHVPIEYTNYVGLHTRQSDAPPDRSGTVLVSAGGGVGGEALLRCAVQVAQCGLLPQFRLVIAGGLLLPDDTWLELQRDCAMAKGPVLLLRWIPDFYASLREAEVSVSRCGYNTAQDLVAARARALVLPYVTPENLEQAKRAEVLARRGLLRLAPDSLTPRELAKEILATSQFEPAQTSIRLDGAAQTAAILSRLLYDTEAAMEL